MMNRDMKNDIDTRLSNITVSDALKEKILSYKRTPSRTPKKHLAIAFAVILCITLSVTVLAITVPSFWRLLSIVSPQISDNLQPVEISNESNGINMEVVAAMNDEEMAVVYLTMKDLTSDRINKSIDLYNYNITGASGFTHEVVDYDETTKTATMRMMATGGQNLNGKQVTLSINSFLAGSKTFDRFNTNINLADVSPVEKTNRLNMSRIPGGGGALYETLRSKGEIDILKADEKNIALPDIDFAYISNIGVIDGKLHIQVKWTKKEIEKPNIDDHGSFLMIGSDNNILYPTNVDFSINEYGNTQYGNGYTEYIFDVNPQTIADYSLVGEHFATSGDYIEGNWQASFKIEAVKSIKKAVCSIDVNGMNISSVSLSPLGITLFANGNKTDRTDIEISIPALENLQQSFSKFSDFSYNNKFVIKYIPIEPLDIENIDTIYVNGVAINFSNR